MRVNVNDRYQFRNTGELASQMGSSHNAYGSMVYHWTRDTDRKKYTSIDFVVDYKNNDTRTLFNDYTDQVEIKNDYNKFIRPPWVVMEDKIVYEKCGIFFDYLENVLSSGDPKIYKLLLDWIVYNAPEG